MGKKQLYELKWEILSSAELILTLPANAPVPREMMFRIYSGNGLQLMLNNAVPRKWGVTIETKAKHDNGEIHTLKLSYKPDSEMYLSELINGVKSAWFDDCDTALAGMTAISAHAVARCLI